MTRDIIVEMQQLRELLQRHDWYFEYSDDHSVYMRGYNQRNKITAMVQRLGQRGRDIYNDLCPPAFKKPRL